MTTLLLVRHGETDWNAEGRLQGHTDRPLNARGREQARALAEELAGDRTIEAVYSSDLLRARETAEIIGARLGLPVVVDPDLRERSYGSREGTRRFDYDHRADDAEPLEEHAARVLRAVRHVVERHPDGRVLVVTHGGSLRRIQEAVSGEPLPVAGNCAVWPLLHEDGAFRPLD